MCVCNILQNQFTWNCGITLRFSSIGLWAGLLYLRNTAQQNKNFREKSLNLNFIAIISGKITDSLMKFHNDLIISRD